MRRNVFGAIVAVLLTALIVASGMLIPRITLEAQREELLSRSGAVEAKSLTPYGNSSKSLTQHISALAQLVDSTFLVDGFDSLAVNERAPLDTELSAHDAELAAEQFFQYMAASVAKYGLTLFESNGSSSFSIDSEAETYASDYEQESPALSPYVVNAMLLTSADDSALSLWFVASPDSRVVLLDALSGIPIYAVLEDEEFAKTQLALTDSSADVFWQIAADTYNALYSEQMTFPEGSQDFVSADKDSIVTWSAKGSEDLKLNVSVTPKHITGIVVQISA